MHKRNDHDVDPHGRLVRIVVPDGIQLEKGEYRVARRRIFSFGDLQRYLQTTWSQTIVQFDITASSWCSLGWLTAETDRRRLAAIHVNMYKRFLEKRLGLPYKAIDEYNYSFSTLLDMLSNKLKEEAEELRRGGL